MERDTSCHHGFSTVERDTVYLPPAFCAFFCLFASFFTDCIYVSNLLWKSPYYGYHRSCSPGAHKWWCWCDLKGFLLCKNSNECLCNERFIHYTLPSKWCWIIFFSCNWETDRGNWLDNNNTGNSSYRKMQAFGGYLCWWVSELLRHGSTNKKPFESFNQFFRHTREKIYYEVSSLVTQTRLQFTDLWWTFSMVF